MTDPDNPEAWLSLPEIREVLPKGNWRHNRLFEDVSLSTEMKLQPSVFWAFDETDQALLLARARALATMQAYEQHLAESKKDEK